MTNHALSHGANAGIAVGVVVVFFFLVIAPLCLSKRQRKYLINFEHIPKPKVTMSQVQFPSSVATFFALPNGTPRFKDDSIEYRFMALLALFGSNGVPLRELIMLASLRMSIKISHNHWLIDGERGTLRDSIAAETTYGDCSFLAAFIREASTIESIEIFQGRLVSLHLINIEYQDLIETLPSAQKCWFMDGRIWRTNQSSSYSSSFPPQLLFEVFSEVFAEIPCKDISPLAERQREIYYYHAHQALIHLYENSFLRVEHPQKMKHVVLVILQVLSHRFQKNDEALLRFARQHLPRSGLHPDWNMILLVAELKATISTKSGMLWHVRDKVFQAVKISSTRGDSSPRAKGLIGWLLVELLDTAEVQDCIEVIDDTVRKGKQWMRRVLSPELSSLEQIMLCRVFARFGTSDLPEPQPRQYDLLFGYQLSRAGCTKEAEELLLSGLEYYASSPISTRIWSYRFELVSLMLRAGRWSEAEAWLASARESAIYRNRAIHDTDFWKRSGECGETFILLGLYQADCDMAMGKLKPAEDRLKDTMEETFFVRDYYIRALRLALRTRLLNVQMWQEDWERATVTARNLVEDTIASGQCLSTTRSTCSVVVVVLALINKLLWVGDVLAAARLLESLKRFEDADHNVLPLDIKLYLERRRAAVSHLLSLEGSLMHKRHLGLTLDGSSGYVRHLEESGANAEDAITSAPPVDPVDLDSYPISLRARLPTDLDTQAIGTMPSHSGPHLLGESSAYKWSSELEHARFPTPEAEELDYLKVQSDEGYPVAERLAQAPPPPSHGPYALEKLTRGGREREIPLYQIS